MHLINYTVLVFLFFIFPHKKPKIKYFKVTSSNEIIDLKNSEFSYDIGATINNFNANSFYDILAFHCYELETKDTSYSLKLIYKKEKINPSKLIRFVNRENNSLSKNWEYFIVRKDIGKTVWKGDFIYLSADSSFIGVVKVKNMEK